MYIFELFVLNTTVTSKWKVRNNNIQGMVNAGVSFKGFC